MMENLKRPSVRETDEDLLKQQELFLKNKEKPSVSLKNKSQSEKVQSTSTDSPEKETSEVKQNDHLIVHQEEVLLEVKERTVSNEPFVFTLPSLPPDEVINSLDKKLKSSKFSAKRKEKSIFAQLMKEEEELKTSACLPASSYSSLLVDGTGLENGSEEAKKLHEENQLKISTMSEEEILKYQEQLKNSLDPSVLKFIQSKRKGKKGVPQSSKNDCSTVPSFKMAKVIQPAAEESLSFQKILRQEGRRNCDALILENSLEQANRVEEPNIISSMKHKNTALPEEAKKLLYESKKRKWKNMDKIEKEKLEWLSELPKPNPIDLKTGYTARFDFEGKLLAHGIDVPTHKGLHHHGDEPEIAGYSLEELFLLARSTLQSQRITALHTIAHILDNYWYGRMDSCFDSPLLPILLEAGIVPLLRWSLDDTSVTSVAATITAIHSLLICKPDEACLHKTFCWLNGHLLPQIEPTDLEEPNVVVEELTDAHLIKLDVVKGFLRIDILPRFLYVLQVMQPPPLVCKLIIEICGHLAQHSIDSSCQVAKYPGLLKLIFEKFLPFIWQYVEGNKLTDTVNYSCPLPSAMKLIRIIASSNKELALYLIENFDLVKVMTIYLTIRPMDKKLSPSDVQSVMVETLKTLHILLRYGCCFEIVLDLYPILLRQMEFCLSLDLNEESKLCQDFEYASHFFKTLEAVLIVSAEETERFELNALMNAIFKQSLVCLKKWLYQMKQERITDRAMTLLAAALNFVSMFYKKSHKGLTCDDWEPCSAVKDMYTGYLIPCIRSEVFKNMLEQIQMYSLLLSSEQSGNKRDGKTLVSLGSVLWKGDVVPILKEGTLVPLLLATLNFIFVHKTLFNDGDNQFLEELLSNASLLEYLKKIKIRKLNMCSWFARYETYLLTLLLKLSPFIAHNNLLDWHRIAASLLPILKMPDECLIEDLFENIIFNEAFLPSSHITDVCNVIAALPVIAKCYISYFLDEKLVLKSRSLLFGGLELNSVSFLSNPKSVLPKDWCYAPIFDLYHDSSKKITSETLTPEDLLLITSSLQWTLLCRELSLPLLKGISASVEFRYLSMVFLLDCDCFRHKKIRSLLEANLSDLLRRRTVSFSRIISENFGSFDDLYLELLNQFEAVSYGDPLFGNYILVPLQQCHHNKWKKVLLTDHSEAISFLRVPLTELIVPVQNYLEPYETDEEILKGYLNLLLSGALIHRRCPLLYLMAVHHIHHFIFLKCNDHIKSQKFLVMSITRSKNEIIKRHLLLYSEANVDSEFGFTLKTELTPSDERHLSHIAGQSVNL